MRNFVHPFTAVSAAVCGFALLPIYCAAFAQEPQQPQVVDGMAAIVNGDVITYSQVRQLSAPREKLLRSQFTGQELENKLQEVRKLALKDLIDRRLIIQAFKKESYQIPDHIVDQRVHDIIRESFGGDRNTFVKTLEAQSYSLGEFKEKEMERIIVSAMRSHNVKTNYIISPTKIEDFYRKHRDLFTTKEEIKFRMIMISGQKDTGNAQAQKSLAEEVLGKLAAGGEFEQTAQIYSEDSTKENGGDWGWIGRNTLAAPLENQYAGRQNQQYHRLRRQLLHLEGGRQTRRHHQIAGRSARRYREKTDSGRSAANSGTLGRQPPPKSLYPPVLIKRSTSGACFSVLACS